MTGPGHQRLVASSDYSVLLLVVLGLVGSAGVLELSGSTAFWPYFGGVSPLLATTSLTLVGVAALAFLRTTGFFEIDARGPALKKLARPAGLATLLAVPVIAVDLAGGFPEDLNVLPPQSLLFYPVIALVAETVFHLVPLALLILGARSILKRSSERVLWPCMLLVSIPEPILQVVSGWGDSPSWATAYVGVHVFVFNVLAVYLYKRQDFLSMYSFRFVYYMHWHIVWGFLRLRVLF